jgi:ribonuclease P protein component
VGLPQGNRLKRRQDFQAVYQQGDRYSSPHLILRALPPSQATEPSQRSPCQLGISISQKVSKKAVTRNLIKRRIRAAFRELLPHLSPGWKLVIVVRSQAVECNYEHFLRELKQLFVKAEII